uniref:Uncharacterized protein n=1 Tax=Rhizophora mucronata TaxID=61149 RepID=A0A2P2Q383_RHIMU
MSLIQQQEMLGGCRRGNVRLARVFNTGVRWDHKKYNYDGLVTYFWCHLCATNDFHCNFYGLRPKICFYVIEPFNKI